MPFFPAIQDLGWSRVTVTLPRPSDPPTNGLSSPGRGQLQPSGEPCPVQRWPTGRHCAQADPTPSLLRAPHSFFSGRTGVWMRAQLLTSALLVPTGGPSHAVTSGRWLSLLGLERPPLRSKDGAERPQGSSGNETSSLAQSRSSICGSC